MSDSEVDDDAFEVLNKTQIYDFVPPMAGMFTWVHYRFETHPVALASAIPLERLAHAFWIFQTKEPYLVLTAPGTIFAPTDKIRDEKAWQYFRLCFAAINEKDVKTTSERFVRASHDFWELDEEAVQKMLDEDESENGAFAERFSNLRLQEEGKWAFSPLMC